MHIFTQLGISVQNHTYQISKPHTEFSDALQGRDPKSNNYQIAIQEQLDGRSVLQEQLHRYLREAANEKSNNPQGSPGEHKNYTEKKGCRQPVQTGTIT
ncbi:hypothetical protein AVEN_187657-1 [Araneus ventricosus]|uniref:Uncharacterized protein n=1 Tax=Araneus ventricosus TaxID=182803 RepID=A0A4Y2U3K2_ARAVE|nr:hypothetical protein AVEN_187657-1 [Araneus ventricosus]